MGSETARNRWNGAYRIVTSGAVPDGPEIIQIPAPRYKEYLQMSTNDSARGSNQVTRPGDVETVSVPLLPELVRAIDTALEFEAQMDRIGELLSPAGMERLKEAEAALERLALFGEEGGSADA